MSDTVTPKATHDAPARARYRAALASAAVAGAFVLVVAGLLAARHAETATLGLQKSQELADLRTAVLKASDNATRARLLEEVRARDEALRHDFFRRQAFSRTGGYLLLAGIVAFLVAASQAAAYWKRLPMPRVDPEAPRKAARASRRARWAVGAVGGAVGAAALALLVVSGGPRDGSAAESADAGPPPSAEEIRKHWPRFRGPDGCGVAAYTNAPTAWNGKTGEGILWKAAVPLPGENSPVVWGRRLFVTGAEEKEREVYCFDTETGNLLWRKPVTTSAGAAAEPPEVLEDTGFAAPTAATDGRRVAAVFANGDLACFDLDGRPLWTRHLGPLQNSYGHASSLAMYRDLVLVLADQGSTAKPKGVLLGLDARTGRTAWEVRRPVGSSWASPIVAAAGSRDELLTAAYPWAIAYDPASGAELWRAKVLDGDVAPSPVAAGGLAFFVNAGAQLAAIRMGGSGDVTATAVAWTAEDGLPDIVSPLATAKAVLLVTTDGLLTYYDAKTGKGLWEHEIQAIFMSSPTLVGDRVYLTTVKGVTHLFSMDGGFKELGKAELGEPVHASPAVLDGRLYFRGKKHLYAIGAKPQP